MISSRLYLTSGKLDVHGLAIEGDSVVLSEGLLRVGSHLEDDFRRSQGDAVAIVVDVRPF